MNPNAGVRTSTQRHARAAGAFLLGATLLALFVATMAAVPTAFAQQEPPGAQQSSAGMAALPGFPGTPHIYHIGATGFFLDHAGMIRLTPAQQAALNGIKAKSNADSGAAQRGIDQAEQELWVLTSSDQPDSMALETKVRQIERLKGDRRIAFIRSVGEAARMLSADQRAALIAVGAARAAPMTLPPGAARLVPTRETPSNRWGAQQN